MRTIDLRHGASRAVAALLFLLLTACGGGGDGTPNTSEGNLAVAYSYPYPTVQRFSLVSIKPTVNQLGSNTPHFSIVSGSLPAGLQFNGSTGEISGVPTGNFATPLTIALTVDGFSGSLSASTVITVHDFWFMYLGSPYGLVVGDPIVAGTTTPASAPLAAGATVAFSVDTSSPLPTGLAVNSATGEITGASFQLAANTDSRVNATLTYGGVTYNYFATVTFGVRVPFATFSYHGNGSTVGSLFAFYGPANQALTGGAPVLSTTPTVPGDTLDGFALVNDGHDYFPAGVNTLPPGVSLNPTTGLLSGAPTVPGQYWVNVSATFHRGVYSTPLTSLVFFNIL